MIVLHAAAGVLFALSVPVGLALIALAQLSGSCGGVTTPKELADARWVMIEVGVVWCLLPFGAAVAARLLRSRWLVWVILGCLVLGWAVGQAVTTTSLSSLFCM